MKNFLRLFLLVSLALASTGCEDQAAVHFQEGVRFAEEGESQKAVDAYTEVIRIDPANADAYCNRAHLVATDRRLGPGDQRLG